MNSTAPLRLRRSRNLMVPPILWRLCTVVLVLSCGPSLADDVVELNTGAKVRGKVISQDGSFVTVEVKVGNRSFRRRYPKSGVRSVQLENQTGPDQAAMDQRPQRSRDEVLSLIDRLGRTPPEWFDATNLNYPKTLDLKWPLPAPAPWNSQKNVGQFIWDRVNPNPSQWRNGVKLMHHIMTVNAGNRTVIEQAMRALGGMYHNLHQDYARAAFWWQQAGLDREPMQFSLQAVHLAHCYAQLGNQQLALDLLKRMDRYPLAVIKLMGDLGETDEALVLAERFAKQSDPVTSYLYAGDVCRVAGRIDDAESYYQKALSASKTDNRRPAYVKRDRQRIQASLAAIRFYQIEPQTLADGTYRASSFGYEDLVHVEVQIRSGRIADVKVTKHREKQFYSALTDTPQDIIQRQSVVNVDTTSGATITSEAIINATAQALSQGQSRSQGQK